MFKQDDHLIQNRLLAALPKRDYQRLSTHLKTIVVTPREMLYRPDEPIKYVYFPGDAVASLIWTTEEGSTIEVGIVGNEGVVGIPVVLGFKTIPNQAMVQIGGTVMRMKADVLKEEFNRCRPLQEILLCYTYALLIQISRSVVCSRLHTLEERLSRSPVDDPRSGKIRQLDAYP